MAHLHFSFMIVTLTMDCHPPSFINSIFYFEISSLAFMFLVHVVVILIHLYNIYNFSLAYMTNIFNLKFSIIFFELFDLIQEFISKTTFSQTLPINSLRSNFREMTQIINIIYILTTFHFSWYMLLALGYRYGTFYYTFYVIYHSSDIERFTVLYH